MIWKNNLLTVVLVCTALAMIMVVTVFRVGDFRGNSCENRFISHGPNLSDNSSRRLVSPALLKMSVHAGTQFITGHQSADGTFDYAYDWSKKCAYPITNPEIQITILWQLLQIYQVTGNQEILSAIVQGCKWWVDSTLDISQTDNKKPEPKKITFTPRMAAITTLCIVDILRVSPDIGAEERAALKTRLDQAIAYLLKNEDSTGWFSENADVRLSGAIMLALIKAAGYGSHDNFKSRIENAIIKDYLPWFDNISEKALQKSDLVDFYPWALLIYNEMPKPIQHSAEQYSDRIIHLTERMLNDDIRPLWQKHDIDVALGMLSALKIADEKKDKLHAAEFLNAIDEVLYKTVVCQIKPQQPNVLPGFYQSTDTKAIGGVLSSQRFPVLQTGTTCQLVLAAARVRQYCYPESRKPNVLSSQRSMIGNGLLYIVLAMGGCIVLWGTFHCFSRSGYPHNRILLFLFLIAVVFVPSIDIASRLFRMFFYPSSFWDFRFFLDQVRLEPVYSLPASLIFTAIVCTIIIRVMGFKLIESLETLTMYIPLGNAVGSMVVILYAVCGVMAGHTLFSETYLGLTTATHLFYFCVNMCLFVFLRWCYHKIYIENNRLYSGMILSFYLIITGNAAVFLNRNPSAPFLAWGFTHTQLLMAFLSMIGFIGFCAIMIKNMVIEREIQGDNKKYDIALLGFFTVFIPFIIVATHLLTQGIIKWPFHNFQSLLDVFGGLSTYAPFILLALSSLIWLKITGIPIAQMFHWKTYSHTFVVGMIVSFGCTFFLLQRIRFGADGGGLWLAVVCFSLLNAVCEEMIFRGVLFQLLKQRIKRPMIANVIQSMCYASLHFYPAGPRLAMGAWFYGLLQGHIHERNRSLIPVIMCHVIIDIGFFGLAILSREKLF